MQTANNPISHHTSHTMANGASSSGGDDPSGTGSHPIRHHTSHTLENGASSCNQGAYGEDEVQSSNGRNQSGNVEATLMRPPTELSKLNIHDTINEPENGLDTEVSSPYSSAESTAEDTDDDNGDTLTQATSMTSSGNLATFNIIDSTLREGEQFATAYFGTAQKIAIARALDDFGVEYIEVTSPAASEQSRSDCAAICKLGLRAKILCHIRCNMDDARIAVSTGVDGINMCIGTSTQLMTHSHGKDMDYIAAKASEVIEYVKSNNIEIRFSGEDSFRSDFKEILKLYTLMDRLGANRVGIADTVGGATPLEVYDKISALRNVVDCDIETHFHNDTGCAIANAFVALEAGATHIDTTVLGIGERNGITSLRGLVAGLIRKNVGYNMNKYNMEKLDDLERLVAGMVEVDIPFNNCKVSVSQWF